MKRLLRLVKGARILLGKISQAASDQRRPIETAIAMIKKELTESDNSKAFPDDTGLLTARHDGVDFLMAGDLDDIIERRIAYDGVWEPVLLSRLFAAITPDSLFVDVGANIGALSIPVAIKGRKMGLHVFSIEANSNIAVRLRRNIALNGLSNITVIEKAVSDTRGEKLFYQTLPDAPNKGLSGLLPNLPPGERLEVEIEAMTLDDIVLEKNGDYKGVSAMKIDVEGAELQVIRGAAKVLRFSRPALFFECLKRDDRSDTSKGAEIQRFLAELGYRCFSLSDRKHYYLPEADLSAGFSGDVMAVPIDRSVNYSE